MLRWAHSLCSIIQFLICLNILGGEGRRSVEPTSDTGHSPRRGNLAAVLNIAGSGHMVANVTTQESELCLPDAWSGMPWMELIKGGTVYHGVGLSMYKWGGFRKYHQRDLRGEKTSVKYEPAVNNLDYKVFLNETYVRRMGFTATSTRRILDMFSVYDTWGSSIHSMYDPPDDEDAVPLGVAPGETRSDALKAQGEGHAAIWIGDQDKGDRTVYVVFDGIRHGRFTVPDLALKGSKEVSLGEGAIKIEVKEWTWDVAWALWVTYLQPSLKGALEKCPGCNLMITGNSHGGVLAQVTAFIIAAGKMVDDEAVSFIDEYYAVSWGAYKWVANEMASSLVRRLLGNRLLALVGRFDFSQIAENEEVASQLLPGLDQISKFVDPLVGYPKNAHTLPGLVVMDASLLVTRDSESERYVFPEAVQPLQVSSCQKPSIGPAAGHCPWLVKTDEFTSAAFTPTNGTEIPPIGMNYLTWVLCIKSVHEQAMPTAFMLTASALAGQLCTFAEKIDFSS